MICYGDRTWCPKEISETCRLKSGCYKVFTDEDRKRAIEWWGSKDFPISQFTQPPPCHSPTNNPGEPIEVQVISTPSSHRAN